MCGIRIRTARLAAKRAEFLLQHGFLDAVVPRKDLKAYLAQALSWMTAAETA